MPTVPCIASFLQQLAARCPFYYFAVIYNATRKLKQYTFGTVPILFKQYDILCVINCNRVNPVSALDGMKG